MEFHAGFDYCLMRDFSRFRCLASGRYILLMRYSDGECFLVSPDMIQFFFQVPLY